MVFKPPSKISTDALLTELQIIVNQKPASSSSYDIFSIFSAPEDNKPYFEFLGRIINKVKGTVRETEILIYALTLVMNSAKQGGKLSEAIKEYLGITDNNATPNQISDHEYYYYLDELQKFINFSHDRDFEDLKGNTKSDILARIASQQAIVQKKLEPCIRNLVTAFPDVDVLIKNLDTNVEKYQAIHNQRNWFTRNNERMRSCNIWQFIKRSALTICKVEKNVDPHDEDAMMRNIDSECRLKTILASAMYATCMEIDSKAFAIYNGSELFALTMPGINQVSIKEKSSFEKELNLSTLISFLEGLRSNKIFMRDNKLEWDTLKMDEYLAKLIEDKEKLFKERNKAGTAAWLLANTLGWGAGIVLAEGIAIGAPMLLGVLPIAVGGISGVVFAFTIGSSIILFPMVYSKIISPLAVHIFSSGIRAAGDQIGKQMAKMASTKDSCKLTDNFDPLYLPAEDKIVHQKFLQALLDSNQIPDVDKARIRGIKGFEKAKEEDLTPRCTIYARA